MHYFQLVFNEQLDKDFSFLIEVFADKIVNKSQIFSVPYQRGVFGGGATIVAGSITVVTCGGRGGGWPYSGSSNPTSPNWTEIGTGERNGGGWSYSSRVAEKRREIEAVIGAGMSECLENTRGGTLNMLIDVLNSDLYDPCTGESIDPAIIVEEIISEYCRADSDTSNPLPESLDELYTVIDQNSISYNEVLSTLQTYDYIDIRFSEGSRLNCIYNKFFNTDNNVLCDLTSRFFSESRSNLFISDELSPADLANARTGVIEGSHDIRIRFRREYVEQACEIDIMRTLLHELIHAEFRALEFDPSIDNSSFLELYSSYMENENWDHEAMARFYRDRIAEGLREIYGNRYTNEEYEAMAWRGLNEYAVERIDGTTEYHPITQTWVQIPQDRRDNIRSIQENALNNCSDDECI